MSTITFERAATLLADLVALPTVNPMGRPRPLSEPVEHPVVEYLERLFAGHPVRTERQRCDPHHESLLVLLPGRHNAPWSLFESHIDTGSLFESHIDTVPADDWPDRAFTPRLDGRALYGRGACDDKGCLAAMALALLSLLEDGTTPRARSHSWPPATRSTRRPASSTSSPGAPPSAGASSASRRASSP